MSSHSERAALAQPAGQTNPARLIAIATYRALAATAVIVAIVYELAEGLGREGISTTDYFSYFTELSNLFAAAMFLYGSVRVAPRVRLEPVRTIALWMAFPFVYVAYTLVRGAIVDWYPYFFVSPHRHGGYLVVVGDCLAISVGIAGLIAATCWVGNRRARS